MGYIEIMRYLALSVSDSRAVSEGLRTSESLDSQLNRRATYSSASIWHASSHLEPPNGSAGQHIGAATERVRMRGPVGFQFRLFRIMYMG